MIAAVLAYCGVAQAVPLNPADFTVVEESLTAPPGTVVNTDELRFGDLVGEEYDGVAVFTFGSLVVDDLVVTGSRPLALLATGDLTVRGEIDLSANGETGGPGGGDATGSDGEGVGGGRAAIAGTGGGHCGAGGATDNGENPGGSAYGDLLLTLTGGSAGGASTDAGGRRGGGGGGAIELGALGRLIVDGVIRVRGADAQEANTRSTGGGGAGGGVLLHGGLGSVSTAQIHAEGGAGGDVRRRGAPGGGGGGGCLVLLGVRNDATASEIRLAGGNPGTNEASSERAAEPGRSGSVLDFPDPDYDGDGFTLEEGDCNDLDPTLNPGADDVPDGLDNDCDGVVDPLGDTGDASVDPLGDTGDASVDPLGGTADASVEVRNPSVPGFRLWSCHTAGGGPGAVVLALVGLFGVTRRRAGRR